MIHFQIAFPIREDAELVRHWRNDSLAREMSFSYRSLKTFEEFFPEFVRKYFTIPSLPPLFAVAEGVRIGLIRFDPVDASSFFKGCEISLIIAPEMRNRGYGTQILKELDPFLIRQGIEGVVARILQTNQASKKAFLNGGYQIIEENEVIRLEKRLMPAPQPHVFVIAEAGSNWYVEGDKKGLQRGIELIECAKEAGADAVKFQTFTAKETYAPGAGASAYLKEGGIDRDIEELFKDLEISREMIHRFQEHCDKMGIEFMSSVFSFRDFDLIDPLVKRHKIASYEISHFPLIALAARSGKPLILSTGASDVSDIDAAVDAFYLAGGFNLTLMQCTAKYPASSETMNLEVIPWLKSRYGVSAGLSDHSAHPYEAPLAAVALGALCIEKHFTISRTLKGPDHGFAIEPKEFKELVQSIRALEKMRGTGFKKVEESEKELYFFCRRSIQALQDIQPGEILANNSNMAILRPGHQKKGASPAFLEAVNGKRARRKIARGEGIEIADVEL